MLLKFPCSMPHPQFTDPETSLLQAVQRLTVATERANSPGRALVRGLLLGVGTAIGASVVAATLLSGFWRFTKDIGLDQALRNAGIEARN
jgi:hypothetical protein